MTDKIIDLAVKSLTLCNLLVEADYVIPMYQRNYAWGKPEIQTLINDVIDACQKNSETQYYIGTLVVFKRQDGRLEVIDGQQRFTTLTLLSICLKNLAHHPITSTLTSSLDNEEKYYLEAYDKLNISFESRPESSNTLELLFHNNLERGLKYQSLNQSIIDGYDNLKEIILQEFHSSKKAIKSKITFQQFYNYLFNKVIITQVPVPQETDLNHYFEVMNNRGEQLEKHEIIKARILSIFQSALKEPLLPANSNLKNAISMVNTIWEACANIDKYIQYGFNTTVRGKVFSNTFNEFLPKDFDELLGYFENIDVDKHTTENTSHPKLDLNLLNIINSKVNIPTSNPDNISNRKNDTSETHYSVINFSNFLLHVLRIMLNHQGKQIDIALDDKQLLDQFNKHILSLNSFHEQLDQCKNFIYALIKTKYLFDQYIIKRNTQQDKGHWTIEQLKKTHSNSSYVQSLSEVNNKLVMLQSAFHISAPTMNYKHWLNASLYYLYHHYKPHHSSDFIDGEHFHQYLELLARSFMLRRFLSVDRESYYDIIYKESDYFDRYLNIKNTNNEQAVELLRFRSIQSNFVFAYLDYLIWLNQNNTNSEQLEKEKKNFVFTSQGSIEHFFPQNPINATSEQQEQVKDIDLHRFGNLCLIGHSLNSRVSNHVPIAKKQFFEKEFASNIDSLKLYKMIETLKKHNDEWNIDAIDEHENEMFELFKDALGINIKRENNE